MRNVALLRRTVASMGALAVVASSLLVTSPAVADDGPSVVFTSPDPSVVVTDDTVDVLGYVSDPSIDWFMDLNGWGTFPLNLHDGNQFSYNVATLGIQGVHTFTVMGGGITATISYLVDSIGPDLAITSPAPSAVVRDILTLDYTTDGVTTWIAFDGQPETMLTGTPPHDLATSSLSEGLHQLRVRSADPHGNSTTVTQAFTIDRIAPTVVITMPSDGGWLDPELPFAIMAASDDVSSQEWDIRVDGVTVAGGPGGTPFAYGMPAPTSWTNGSSHVITAQATDAAGNTGALATVTVRADKRRPDVSIDAPTAALGRTGTITGQASDTGSGVAEVTVEFRKLRADETCGAVQFSGTATLAGTSWSLVLPGAAVSGSYCVRATATDQVGHTRVASEQPIAVVDVTGPAAPRGLTPSGELWVPPSTISWNADPDAVSYRYRLAATEAGLADADIATTSGASAAPGGDLSGSWFWQVQGVDALGNEGAWSAPRGVVVLGAPVIDGTCSALCGMVGEEVPLSWSAVTGATGYRVAVRWPGRLGDPSDNMVERYLLGPDTSATITLPSDLPSGTIVVQVQAVLDHRVEGSKRGPWSEKLRLLHVAAPAVPALRTPANGAYVDGHAVGLAWSDDSAVFIWELRLASVPTLGADGGLDTASAAPMLDPMVLLILVGGSSGPIPRGIDLDELDAVLDCAAVWDYLGVGPEDELPIGCADGSVTLPEALADGDYYWQVRGYGIGALSSSTVGPWSAVGHFVVGEAPAAPGGGSTGGTVEAGGSATTVDDSTPAAEPEAEVEAGEPPTSPDAADVPLAGGSDAVGGAEEAGAADPGDGFPFWWLLAGIGGLVVLAGAGAFIRFLVVRGR